MYLAGSSRCHRASTSASVTSRSPMRPAISLPPPAGRTVEDEAKEAARTVVATAPATKSKAVTERLIVIGFPCAGFKRPRPTLKPRHTSITQQMVQLDGDTPVAWLGEAGLVRVAIL